MVLTGAVPSTGRCSTYDCVVCHGAVIDRQHLLTAGILGTGDLANAG